MMALVTEIRRMPPWPPVPGHGDFLGARVLTAEQIDTLRRWVEQDMPEGDPAALPPVPEFSDDWHLGPPDVVVRMPVGYPVPAGGPDINRDFWIPVGLDEDKWLVAVETRPGSAALHHIICTLDTDGLGQRAEETDGLPGFAGMQGGAPGSRLLMSGWAIGGTPTRLPPGIAYKIPKGSDMVLRSHIHPTGKAVVEQTALGLYFTDEPPTRTIAFLSLPPFAGMTAGIDIPPGAADFTVTDSFVLPVDAEMTNVYGHQHYLGRSVQMWGTFPDGRRESLFYVDEWDFNWQGGYQYVEPVRLTKGTRMSVELVYDNSSDNPSNPSDPPVRVTWGRQSTARSTTSAVATKCATWT
jgi:hypothetical protein